MQYQNWQREKLLNPLLELQQHDRQGQLQKTIEAYLLLNCDPVKTCQELHIHRNTLRYRLEKINELTSIDINKFYDL